jgi:membrane-anchored glycerophosphoryl diester phosphodiesterase (GDPDase)
MIKQKQQNNYNMKNFFKQLFDDNNTINEKAVVGFIAFLCLVLALLVDLVTGYMGNALVINEFIFDGFMIIILGSFGIASVDKWMNIKNGKKNEDEGGSIEE